MIRDLVYDVGLHRGEDADFYLRKGYSVVGIEANPALVKDASIRFRDAIAGGRLRLFFGAVAPASADNKINFYANIDLSVWGTIDPEGALRNEGLGHRSEKIEVNRIDIAELYRSLGIPVYLKIDIEGLDSLVLEELKGFDDRPQYISLESDISDFSRLILEMNLLKDLGYKKFKLVQQQTIPGTTVRTCALNGELFEYTFEAHASGPFGDDLPGEWLTYDDALEQYEFLFRSYRLFGHGSRISKMPKAIQRVARELYRRSTGWRGPLPGWFDTHASL